MSDRYHIELQRPARPRRGDAKLIIVVRDDQDQEIFRDRADLNVERVRTRIAQRIANLTGDDPDAIARRLLQHLDQLPPPAPAAPGTGVASGRNDFPYEATPGGLIWNKETPEGITPVPLTTFTALITGQMVEDDGLETRRILDLEVHLRQRVYHLQVPAGQFAAMGWAMEHLGAAAALWPGSSIKDHARAAIQFLSGDPPVRQVYTHLGWREVDGNRCFLHAGGAIGPVGPVPDIQVSVPGDLQRYDLPDPPTGGELRAAILASLEMLKVAGSSITFPLYCAIWRSVLGGVDSGEHLAGHTGAGKSELAALVLRHFGSGFDARHFPANWSSTDNSLETLAFLAKDVVLVVDDFCPAGSQYDVQAMHRKADRLFRGQGNTAGRGRMRADGTLRPTRSPRGMLLSTGEDVPKGQSLRARFLVLEVPQQGEAAVVWNQLSRCQTDAAAGLYAQAMAGFIRWLAPQYAELRKDLRQQIDQLREEAYQDQQHRRTPDTVANLAVGFHYFLRFAQEVGALSKAEAEAQWQDCWTALGDAAAAQQEHQSGSDPVNRFLDLLSAAVSSGRAYLSDGDGDAPRNCTAWGWREIYSSSGENTNLSQRPLGEHIGWIVGDDIYLQPDTAFGVVQRLARDGRDTIPVTLATLKKRLKERGLLASTERHRAGDREVERMEVRRQLQGKRRWVLHFNFRALAPTPAESEPSEPDEPPAPHSFLIAGENGSHDGSQNQVGVEKVSHKSEPTDRQLISEVELDGSHGSLGSQMEIDGLLGSKENTTTWEEVL